MLVLEDIESIVNSSTRSYFFNEMDGIESNDGLFVVASTNYLDRLDPGLTKRPSRFDRKYLFPLPSEHERTLYCEYWYRKLKSNENVDFPKKLCAPMAHITPGFSFAFLQECFVATMLALARKDDRAAVALRPYDPENSDGLEDYEIWIAFKEQADILRKEIESQRTRVSALSDWCRTPAQDGEESEERAATSARAPLLCQCCRQRCGERTAGDKVAKGVERLEMKEELLPALAWYEQKSNYVNPAAFEMRI